MVDVERLDWDGWNIAHLRERHGLTPEEVEEVCHGEPVALETYKDRLMLIGPDRRGRVLTVVIGPVPGQRNVYYAFSARPASRKERRFYGQGKGGSHP